MITNLVKHKYVLYLTLIALLWEIITGYLIQTIYPQHYLQFYPLVPIYFYLLNIISYLMIDSFKEKSTSSAMAFLGSKILKLFLSVVILLIYILVVKTQVVEFIIVFILNYLFFLVLDTLLLTMYKPHYNVKNTEGVK